MANRKRKKISFDAPAEDPFDVFLKKTFIICETRNRKRESHEKRVNAYVCKVRSGGGFRVKQMVVLEKSKNATCLDECLGCSKWINIVEDIMEKPKRKRVSF